MVTLSKFNEVRVDNLENTSFIGNYLLYLLAFAQNTLNT
jgi:hypothetical protein